MVEVAERGCHIRAMVGPDLGFALRVGRIAYGAP